jgi:parallel beta-helix repeat protein
LYFYDSEVYGLAVNPTTGQQTGVEIGYLYQAMDISIKDSTLNPVASIASGMAYASTWNSNDYASEWLRIENVSMTHYKGYTPLNNAIQTTDMCVRLYGSDNSYIVDSTLTDCGAGIYFQRSGYSYGHSANEFGADNTTIEGNTFLDGGEIADVWFYTNSYADDAVVKDNSFSSTTGKYGVRAYDTSTKRLTVFNNIFDGPETAI